MYGVTGMRTGQTVIRIPVFVYAPGIGECGRLIWLDGETVRRVREVNGVADDSLKWLGDEIRSECGEGMLQRAQRIVWYEQDRIMGAQCLNSSDGDGTRITLTARMRAASTSAGTYTVQATIDLGDELLLSRYCSCPAFGETDTGGYRSMAGYRDFNADDYGDGGAYGSYGDYDDYDDSGYESHDTGGSTFGHVPNDDERGVTPARWSGSLTANARYTGVCKHVAAMILLFLDNPDLFHGYHGVAGATPRRLADYMRQLDGRNAGTDKDVRSVLLERMDGARRRLAAEQGKPQPSVGRSGAAKRAGMPPAVRPGSVELEPTLVLGYGTWSLQLRITHAAGGANVSYVVRNIAKMVADIRSGVYTSYGRKLAFRHFPEMFSPFSRSLIDFIERAIRSRRIAMLQNHQYASGVMVDRELFLADWEVCDLLDLYHELPASIGLRLDGMTVSGEQGVPIVEGGPDVTFHAEYTRRMASGGVRITGDRTVFTTIAGQHSRYILASKGGRSRPEFHRCPVAFAAALHALESLCTGEPDGVFVHENDWPMFARTILPALAKAGIGFDVPQEIAYIANGECGLEFYLDRDLNGITCEAVARYGDFVFQLVPAAKALRGIIHPDSTSRASLVKRDVEHERLGVELVEQLFTEHGDHSLACIDEQDEDAVLLLLTDGVGMLRSIGEVFSTAAFDGMLKESAPTVKVGLSIDSNLVEISPVADEVPMNEVGSLLASYRRRRRYHRLRDGSFVDLKDADLDELDTVAVDFGLTERQLNEGGIELPGYQAFLLDSDVSDTEKSASFRAYVDDVKVIDPRRYEVPQSLRGVLRPYQVEGFQWLSTLCDKGFGGILADEMGLGKSLQTLTLLESRKGNGCSLIVCPASLVYNWAAECAKFTPDLHVEIVAGSKAERRRVLATVARPADADDTGESGGTGDTDEARAADAPDILITSYDLLRRDIDDYGDCAFDCVAIDEAQYIKNHTTKVAKAVKRLRAEHRFALTGTPIENRLSELWSIFDFLMPGLLGSYARFRERYEQPILAPGPERSVMAAKLQALVGLFIKRRLKRDVLTDLPDKFENVVTVRLEGEQRKLYAAHEQRLRASLDKVDDADFDTSRIRILAEFTLLREICCSPKLVYADAKNASAKLDAIDDLVSSCMDSGKKVLIFSQFTSFLDLIGERLAQHGVAFHSITGETPKKRRVELVDRFNGDDVPVFLISLKAGNTGLNLVGASVVIHADPWWNAAAQNQATDRAHRIGQTHDVNVYQIVAQDTIEERILRLQKEKSELARQFTDGTAGGGVGSLTKDELLGLLS